MVPINRVLQVFDSSSHFLKFRLTILSQALTCEISAHTSINKMTLSLLINKSLERTKFHVLTITEIRVHYNENVTPSGIVPLQ